MSDADLLSLYVAARILLCGLAFFGMGVIVGLWLGHEQRATRGVRGKAFPGALPDLSNVKMPQGGTGGVRPRHADPGRETY